MKRLAALLFAAFFVLSAIFAPIVLADTSVEVTIVVKDAAGNIFYYPVYVTLYRTRTLLPDEKIWAGYINGSKQITVAVTPDSKYHFDVEYPYSKPPYSTRKIRYPESKDQDFRLAANSTVTITLPVAPTSIRLDSNYSDISVKLVEKEGRQVIEFGAEGWEGIAHPGKYKALIEIGGKHLEQEVELGPGNNTLALNIVEYLPAKVVMLKGVWLERYSDAFIVKNKWATIRIDKVHHCILVYVNSQLVANYSVKQQLPGLSKVEFKGNSPDDRYEAQDFFETWKMVAFPVWAVTENHVTLIWYNMVGERALWESPKFWEVVAIAGLAIAAVATFGLAAPIEGGIAAKLVAAGQIFSNLLRVGAVSAPTASAMLLGLAGKIGISLAVAGAIGYASTQILSDYSTVYSTAVVVDITPMSVSLAAWSTKNSSGGAEPLKTYFLPSGDLRSLGDYIFWHNEYGNWYDVGDKVWTTPITVKTSEVIGEVPPYIFRDLEWHVAAWVFNHGALSGGLTSEYGDVYESYAPPAAFVGNRVSFFLTPNPSNFTFALSSEAGDASAPDSHGNLTYDWSKIARPDVSGAAAAGSWMGIYPMFDVKDADKFSITWPSSGVIVPAILFGLPSLKVYSNKPDVQVLLSDVVLRKNLPVAYILLPSEPCSLSLKQYWDVSALWDPATWTGEEPSIYIDGFGAIKYNTENFTQPTITDIFGSTLDRWKEGVEEWWNSTLSGLQWSLAANPITQPFVTGVNAGPITIPNWFFWILLGLGILLLVMFLVNPAALFLVFAALQAQLRSLEKALKKRRGKR